MILIKIFIALALMAVASAMDCPAGNFMRRNGDCVPCPVGTFQPKANKYGCRPCPDNKIAKNPGSTACTPCSDNTTPNAFNHRCICIEGFVKENKLCVICKPGTMFVKAGSFSYCSSCSSGYFQPDSGKLDCLKCPDGTQSGHGATECLTCKKGQTLDKNKNKCRRCKPGFSPAAYSGACTKCQVNTFKAKLGNSPCLPCPIGTHSGEGATECTGCPKGKALFKDGTCGNCDAGSYFDMFGGRCRQCGFNQFTPHNNIRLSCYVCNGKKFALKGSTRCTSCPKHSFLFRNGKCQECPLGSVFMRYNLKCEKCRVNQFSRGDMDYCETCPSRTFALQGATTCFICPDNKALLIGTKKCGSCKAGSYYSRYDAKCMKCYEGTIMTGRGVPDQCKSCSSGVSNDDRTECIDG